MSESGGQSIVSHDVGGISTVKSRCDLKGSIVDACLSDDANRIVLITDLGDAFMVSDNSKWVLNSRDKASVIGLEYGHIERVDKERNVYRVCKSSLNYKRGNKPDTYWLTCTCVCEGGRYIVGYGGLDNLFVVECAHSCVCFNHK